MAEPWLSGFLVDERWQFSADDKQSILAAFNPPAGADIEPILACLLDITQVYRSYQANDDRRPSKAVAARQLAAIAEHAAALVRALDSMEVSTAEHLAEVLSKAGKPFHRLSPDAIAADVTALELVAREFQPKGAPSKEALAVYVGRLADLWGRVHQRRPTRVVATGAPARGKLSAAHAAGDEIGAFSRFVETCLSAAGFTGKRPDGIIRKVIAGGRRERNGEKYQVGKTRRPQ